MSEERLGSQRRQLGIQIFQIRTINAPPDPDDVGLGQSQLSEQWVVPRIVDKDRVPRFDEMADDEVEPVIRAVRQEQITREDLEGAKPDWNGEFMEWDSRWRREQLEAVGPRNTDFTIKLAQKEIKAYDAIAKELGMKDGKELAVMILGDAIHPDGMSGLNFLKLGAKIARMIAKSGTGVVDLKQVLTWNSK